MSDDFEDMIDYQRDQLGLLLEGFTCLKAQMDEQGCDVPERQLWKAVSHKISIAVQAVVSGDWSNRVTSARFLTQREADDRKDHEEQISAFNSVGGYGNSPWNPIGGTYLGYIRSPTWSALKDQLDMKQVEVCTTGYNGESFVHGYCIEVEYLLCGKSFQSLAWLTDSVGLGGNKGDDEENRLHLSNRKEAHHWNLAFHKPTIWPSMKDSLQSIEYKQVFSIIAEHIAKRLFNHTPEMFVSLERGAYERQWEFSMASTLKHDRL